MTNSAWDDFLIAAHGGEPERPAVALGADCVYIPRAFGINTLDYFLYPDRWLDANLTLMARFPDAVIFPGLWVEYGMANEPSGFGTPLLWKADEAPAIRPLDLPVEHWDRLRVPDPHAEGLMALVVHRYWNLEHEGELPDPYRVRFITARGPFTTAAHLVGMTNFLSAAADPDAQRAVLALLNTTTEITLRFLQAQLRCLREPAGVLLLDDTVGMLSPRLFQRLALPALNRVFGAFDGLLRVYHNDTPCEHLLPHMGELDFEMWHFSHQMDIVRVREALPDRGLMGNLAPIALLRDSRPDEVEAATHLLLDRVGTQGIVVSLGGGTNADTPAENIDAMVRAARG